MMLNGEEFLVIRYGKNEELNLNTGYKAQGVHLLELKEHVKDFYLIVPDNLTYKGHNKTNATKARKMIGLIMRNFKTKRNNAVILFKSLMFLCLKRCSVLIAPYRARETSELPSREFP